MKDRRGVQFERAQQSVAGETIFLPEPPPMVDPGHDPAARAAADVERILSRAPGLRRIVEVAEAVAGGEDPGAVP